MKIRDWLLIFASFSLFGYSNICDLGSHRNLRDLNKETEISIIGEKRNFSISVAPLEKDSIDIPIKPTASDTSDTSTFFRWFRWSYIKSISKLDSLSIVEDSTEYYKTMKTIFNKYFKPIIKKTGYKALDSLEKVVEKGMVILSPIPLGFKPYILLGKRLTGQKIIFENYATFDAKYGEKEIRCNPFHNFSLIPLTKDFFTKAVMKLNTKNDSLKVRVVDVKNKPLKADIYVYLHSFLIQSCATLIHEFNHYLNNNIKNRVLLEFYAFKDQAEFKKKVGKELSELEEAALRNINDFYEVAKEVYDFKEEEFKEALKLKPKYFLGY